MGPIYKPYGGVYKGGNGGRVYVGGGGGYMVIVA